MNQLHLRAMSTAISALLLLATAAAAQPSPVGVIRDPPHRHGGMHGFHVPFIIVERETVVERDAEPAKPAEPPAPPPPPPRRPYVIGRSYASLPGGCMKMIEGGAAYFLCSGEWYRKAGNGEYLAVARP